jgi:hypothetical protein
MALYAKVEDAECLIPLVVRAVPSELGPSALRDGASPYGYGAPLFTPGISDSQRHECVAACLALACRHDIISLFLRLHPLFPDGLAALRESGVLVRHGQTIYVDLSRDADDIERDLASGHRYEIRRLRKQGFAVVFDDWTGLTEFASIYRQTMQRVSAHASYLFSDDYFSGLRESLHGHVHFAAVMSPNGSMAAGMLFTDECDLMQYHLSGTAEQFVRLAPTKLGLHEVISWGRDRNRRALHLGGGVGGAEDSLFRFKAGFSKLRAEFHTCRIITDSARYQELLDGWTRVSGPASTTDDYFPAYRRSLSTARGSSS